jgi:hypothetical protein
MGGDGTVRGEGWRLGGGRGRGASGCGVGGGAVKSSVSIFLRANITIVTVLHFVFPPTFWPPLLDREKSLSREMLIIAEVLFPRHTPALQSFSPGALAPSLLRFLSVGSLARQRP